MSEAHRRSKQPDPVRSRLLCVAIELIVSEGYESLREVFEPMFNEALAQLMLSCRFAADGLRIAETSGVLRFDDAARTALLNRRLAFTDSR